MKLNHVALYVNDLEKMKFQVKVTPNASKTELVKTETGYKARIQCAPEKGKANEALIALLSEELGIPKSDIEITKGKTSRSKTVLLRN